jgi:hypothetical protein
MWIFGRKPHHGRRRLDAARSVIPGHAAKETNDALCTQFRKYPKQKDAILVRLFPCPLRHQCGFLAGCSSIGAVSTMQTVTMKISPSISSTTHNRSLLDMIIMDLSLTVCVFHLAGRALRDAENLCGQVFCRGRLNSMPTSLNSLLEPSAVWSRRDCTRSLPAAL